MADDPVPTGRAAPVHQVERPRRQVGAREDLGRPTRSPGRAAPANTTALPYASAGAIFHAGIASGKFQGVTIPTTPSGSRITSMSTPGRTERWCSPPTRNASPAKNLKIHAARCASPMPSALGLPSSARAGAELLGTREQLGPDPVERREAARPASRRPTPRGPERGLDRGVHLRRVPHRELAQHIGAVRGIDVERDGRALDPCADEVPVARHDTLLTPALLDPPTIEPSAGGWPRSGGPQASLIQSRGDRVAVGVPEGQPVDRAQVVLGDEPPVGLTLLAPEPLEREGEPARPGERGGELVGGRGLHEDGRPGPAPDES